MSNFGWDIQMGFGSPLVWLLIAAVIWISAAPSLHALSFPTLSGNAGARPVALGEAVGALSDDITTFVYNPASLTSLRFPQASLFYEKGVANDAYGQFMVGAQRAHVGVGASVSYFDEGVLRFYDDAGTTQLHGRQELTTAIGASRSFARVNVGMNAKYMSSQLIEGLRGQTWAADLGLQYRLPKNKTVGMSVRNLGPALTLSGVANPLPREARAGVGLPFSVGYVTPLFLVDGVYDMNNKQWAPAFGVEVPIGLLSLRGGYKNHNNQGEYSFGVGFGLNWVSLDYALVMSPLINAQHKFSLNMAFGSDRSASLARSTTSPATPETHFALSVPSEELHSNPGAAGPRQTSAGKVYVVKAGESWESIANDLYGSTRFAVNLKAKNKHLVDTDRPLEAGQIIILEPVE